MTELKIPERHFSGSLYESKSKADLCNFLHLALWSPCTSKLISAIEYNFLSTLPGLTKQIVQKSLQKSEATVKGHMRQYYKGKQSTHPKEPNETPSKNWTHTHSVFLQATDFSEKNLHRSNRLIPRHIQTWVQIHHGRLRPQLQHNTCQTHEKSQWPRAPKKLHDNPQPSLRTWASTKNALPRQRLPNSLAKIHDWERQTLPTRPAPPPQTKFSRTSNQKV